MSDRTLSTAGGWLSCGAYKKDTSPPGKAAQFGSAVHSRVEEWIAGRGELSATYGGKVLFDGKVDAVATRVCNWLRQEFGSEVFDVLRPEVAYAISPAGNVRELGSRIERAYAEHGATPEDICGSADIVGPGWVCDIKTGREASFLKHRDQMTGLGYCAFETQRVRRVKLVVLHATADGCTPHDGELDVLDAHGFAHHLRQAQALPADKARPGAHCDLSYCARRKVCQAYADNLGQVSP